MTDKPMTQTTKPTDQNDFTSDQDKARWPLIDAGNRILVLLYRVSDQATEDQMRESRKRHGELCSIWNHALAERPK